MLKLKEKQCRELNYYNHYNILENLALKNIDSLIKKFNIGNNTSFTIESNTGRKVIFHPSSKRSGIIQATFIDNNKPIGDREFTSMREAMNDIIGLNKIKVLEIIN